jgi:hypothetical protein
VVSCVPDLKIYWQPRGVCFPCVSFPEEFELLVDLVGVTPLEVALAVERDGIALLNEVAAPEYQIPDEGGPCERSECATADVKLTLPE